jgi:glycosyltransferase involved in cell wall biosynthesis
MRIAVVTPTYRTPAAWLQQCLRSVADQSVPCTHFVVSDGDESLPEVRGSYVQFLRLARPHADAGNAARAAGTVSAICQGFDAVAYLDADNWYERDHLESLVVAQRQSGAAVCTSARNLVDLEGRLLGRCPEVDGERFVDTSCLFVTRPAFGVLSAWYLMPAGMKLAGDRAVWARVLELGLSRCHTGRPTVYYRTAFAVHYRHFGRPAPPGSKRYVYDRERREYRVELVPESDPE